MTPRNITTVVESICDLPEPVTDRFLFVYGTFDPTCPEGMDTTYHAEVHKRTTGLEASATGESVFQAIFNLGEVLEAA